MRYVALVAAILIASPSLARAQWSWSYPKPQGHTLYDIVFLDNDTAIAVGEFGTIMVTHDTGTSWTVSANVQSVSTDLSRVDRLDDNTAVVVGKNGIVLRTTNQGSTWALAPASTSNDLLDVSFADALHGVIAAGNQVLRTSNGGLTWQVTPFASGSALSIDMISTTEAMCVTPLFRSTDGGATWSPITMPADAAGANQVDFLDSLRGAVGRGTVAGIPLIPARYYTTSDGGATWTSALVDPNSSSSPLVIEDLIYPVANRISLVGRREWSTNRPWSGLISRTGTGFGTFHVAWPMNGVAENSNGAALFVGWGGKIMRQTAPGVYHVLGGASQDPTTFGVNGVSFVNPQVGIVFGSEGENVIGGMTDTFIAYTGNGGNTWGRTWVPGQLIDVVGLSSTEFIGVGMDASGTKGIVQRSTNGGATWSLIWSQPVPSRLRAVCAPLPEWSSTHAVAVGSSGTVLHIDNGVVTSVATGGMDFNAIAVHGTSTLVAVGATDMRSYDSGQTWESTDNPGNQTIDITAITFLPYTVNRVLYGIAADGLYYSFESGSQIKIGDFWARELSATGLMDVEFNPSSFYGVAVGSTVFVNNSRNNWTWQPIEKPTPYPLRRVSVPISGLSFMSGPQAITFRHQYQTPLPTLIRSLDVTARNFGVDLRWEVSADENLSGFSITRSTGSVRRTIATNLAVTSRSFRDDDLTPGATYEYQLIAVDRDGSYTQSMTVTVTIPHATLELLPNQPNPFNPVTTIRFVVPERTHLTLTVHDVAGRLVATLMSGVTEPGMRSVTWHADGVASGVYFARLRAGKAETSRKMLLLK